VTKLWPRCGHGTRPGPISAVASLGACRDNLLRATLDASSAAPLLTGARQARARELLAQIDTAVSYCERLAVAVEGGLSASL
jgi:hypothetical protein